MIIQVIAFFLTFVCWGIWIAASLDSPAFQDGTWHIPAVNTDAKTGSQAAVLGTILFNFGFVTTVPSWVNEKKPHVSVNKTVWISTFCCNLVFFAIGAHPQLNLACIGLSQTGTYRSSCSASAAQVLSGAWLSDPSSLDLPRTIAKPTP
eukprot:COSAG02_NODE_5282_length_4473_cov_3.860768_5_plen_149_part_00